MSSRTLDRFAARRSPHCRRTLDRCLESLESRRLLCAVHIDPSKIEFDPGTAQTLAADHAVDTALHGYDRSAPGASARGGSGDAAPFNIVWTNRGNDGFGIFGGSANAARAVVDQVIVDWENRIVNVNQASGANQVNVSISINSSGVGFGGGAGSYTFDSAGKPTSGAISIARGNDTNSDGLGDGAGWYIDPNPADSAEFQGTIVNAYALAATAGGAAAGRCDLYTLVSVEMVHILGITADSGSLFNSSPKWNIINTADTAEGGGVGRFSRFVGPSISHLMTTNNGGPGGTDRGAPLHGAGPFGGISIGGITWIGADDSTNAVYEPGVRYLPSRVAALLMKDGLGYTIEPIESFQNGYALLNPATSTLTIRGGDAQGSLSNDVVSLRVVGDQLRVGVDVSNDVAGTLHLPGAGNLPMWYSDIPLNQIVNLNIATGAGNDTIEILGLPNNVGVNIDAGTGNDTVTFGSASVLPVGLYASINLDLNTGDDTLNVVRTGFNWNIAVNGGDGNETFNVGGGDWDTEIAGNVTLNGGNGGDSLNFLDANDTAGNDTYTIDSTTIRKVTGKVLTYNAVENARVYTTQFADTVNLLALSDDVAMTLYGNDGADTFRIGNGNIAINIGGDLEIWAGAGSDTVIFDDINDTGNDVYDFSVQTFNKTGLAFSIFCVDVQAYDFRCNSWDNTIRITGLLASNSATVRGGGGNDVLDVGGATNDLDALQGALLFDGGTGNDRIDLDDAIDAPVTRQYTLSSAGGTDYFQKTGAALLTMVNHESIGLVANNANSTITVGPINAALRVDGGGGDDYFTIDHDNVTLVSGAGDDILYINNDGVGTAAVVVENLEQLHTVIVGTGGRLTLKPGGNTTLDVSGSFFINGILDLTDGRLIRRSTNPATDSHLQSRLAAGYNGGAWNGIQPAILSSVAASPTHANDALGTTTAFLAGVTQFGNVPVADHDRLVGYTIYGDANLDRTVNFDDLLTLAQNYGTSSRTWGHGDFNYSGNVDFDDLLVLAQQYGASAVVEAQRGPVGASDKPRFSSRRIADELIG